MALKKSEFLSAFGKAFQVWKVLTDEVLSLGGSDEHIRRIETDKDLRRKIAELIVGMGDAAGDLFRVRINHGETLEEMISAGRYDWKNSDINARNFPLNGCGIEEVNIRLVHFNRYIKSEEALRELERMGLRPATLAELLAFGAKYPDEQRKYPVVALGSVWQYSYGYCFVPYLWGDSHERRLHLHWARVGRELPLRRRLQVALAL